MWKCKIKIDYELFGLKLSETIYNQINLIGHFPLNRIIKGIISE